VVGLFKKSVLQRMRGTQGGGSGVEESVKILIDGQTNVGSKVQGS